MTDKTFRLLAALIIFVVCVVVRGALQFFGGPEVGDVNWITTFGAIGASWLGLSGQLGQVERQTNGMLAAKVTDHANAAAERAVAQVLQLQLAGGQPGTLPGGPADLDPDGDGRDARGRYVRRFDPETLEEA